MAKTASKIQLNFFRAEFSTSQISLPVVEFDGWEESTAFLRELPRGVKAHREKGSQSGKVHVFIIGGEYESAEKRNVTLSDFLYLAQALIEAAVANYFRNRNYHVHQDKFQLRVLEAQPAIQHGIATVRRGISIQARRPFENTPDFYVINASWVTPAEFSESLQNETLRSMSLDGGVIFRPGRNDQLTRELRKFRNKFIGTVKEIISDTEIAVDCRDHSMRLIPSQQLYLEAKPNTLVEYDRRLGQSRVSIWSEMLKLNHTLTSAGRRNTSVLRDRLSSIQRMLANGNKRNLSLVATSFDEAVIDIEIVPMTVGIDASV